MIHGGTYDWTEIVAEVIGRPGRVRPHFQPVVDLRHGEVRGYEALARFAGWQDLRPGDVFAAAERQGHGAVLEAHILRAVLAAVPHLPHKRFLAVNASPRALLSPEVRDAVAQAGPRDRGVGEGAEQSDADLDALSAALAGPRARGALVAVDDAGAGYGSLSRITALRPDFVKIDRGLVANVDHDAAKSAVVQTLGELAHRIDAWVIAEGVERVDELDALMALRVPLAQGFALGAPAPAMAELAPDLGSRIRRGYEPAAPELPIAQLIEAVPTLPEPASGHALGVLFDRRPRPEFVALVDPHGRPSGLMRRGDHERGGSPERSLMLVTADMPLAPVTRRAMARPSARRFDPLVCWDESGRYAGLVRIERVVDALAAAA